MDINSVFAYGSVVNVLIKTYTDMSINNIAYNAHEPYTIINNAVVSFNYSNNTKVVSDKLSNIVAEKMDYLSNFVIRNVNMTKKINDLVFDSTKENIITTYMNMTVNDVSIPLSAMSIKIYKNNVSIPSSDFTISSNENNKILSINDFDNTATYLVFYDYIENNTFSLSTPDFPYFEIYIYGKGNKDNETQNVILHIERAKLMANKSINFSSSGGNQIDLYFTVIGDNNSISFE